MIGDPEYIQCLPLSIQYIELTIEFYNSYGIKQNQHINSPSIPNLGDDVSETTLS